MNSWAQKRRLIYGVAVVVFLLVVIGLPLWKVFYKAPTCFDGAQNGKESGIDCGGSCVKLCASAFLSPVNTWTRFEEAAPGYYNVAAYVINPNTDGEAFGAPYHMELYDKSGMLITEYESTFDLPPNRNTLAFKALVKVGQRIPAKAVFRFSGTPDWHKATDRVKSIIVLDTSYKEESNSSSLSVTLKNNDVVSMGKLAIYAILFNKDGNAVGFSSTRLDGIKAGGTIVAPFTWPVSRKGAVISIEVLPVAE
ncbi:MAG: hypothetical protein WCV79_03955 [Candidatus Paceibacterota bacterium]|jgi:hypothetical protein